tara:strand:- start:117 stop:461 length:345 start_codon:yes stop_codon:yes gene_type:complete
VNCKITGVENGVERTLVFREYFLPFKNELPPEEELTLNLRSYTSRIEFKCTNNTRMSKAFDAFCVHSNVSRSSAEFRFDGFLIHGRAMPCLYEMENGDTIDVVVKAKRTSSEME